MQRVVTVLQVKTFVRLVQQAGIALKEPQHPHFAVLASTVQSVSQNAKNVMKGTGVLKQL